MNSFTTQYKFFDTHLSFTTNSEHCNKEFQKVYGHFTENVIPQLQRQTTPHPRPLPDGERVGVRDKNTITEALPENNGRESKIKCSIEQSGNSFNVKAISKRYSVQYTVHGELHTDVYLSLFSPVIYEVRDYFLLHAGSLSTPNGKSLIISAPSGFGKTTNTRELLKYDFKLLSDELAPINIKTGLIHPYPRGMGVLSEKNKSIISIEKENIGQTCKPGFVIFLTLNKFPEEETEKHIEIALGKIDNELVEAFKNIDRVKTITPLHDRMFPMLRLLLEKDAQIVGKIQDVCMSHNTPIIYTLKGKTQAPDFNAQPKLEEIQKKDGIFELSQHILNAHSSALLEETFSGSRPKMIFELAGLMDKARFFTLTVGKLYEMTKLIKELCLTNSN